MNRVALMAVAVASVLMGGCSYFEPKPVEKPAPPQVDSTPAKYDSGPGSTLTPVESSLLLSEKYAALAVDSEKLRQENKRLTDENVVLSGKVVKLQSDYDQASKELREANSMAIDLRIELNNWKNNVLGFRDEMRESQKAQLEALVKIMQLLGGESHAATGEQPKSEGDPNQAK
jgi:outer membrane murein-binding lipoprotein Lpp